MVNLADGEDTMTKRIIVIGFNKFDGNTFKVIQSSPVKLGRNEKLVSRSITTTNHLIATFSNGSSFMMYLDNFRDIHFKRPYSESILVATNDYLMINSSNNVNNVGLCHFTEFFLNT